MFTAKLSFTEPEVIPPHDFQFQLNHYVIPPAIREEQRLILVLRTESGRVVRTEIESDGTTTHPKLSVSLMSSSHLSEPDLEELRRQISRHLCLQEDLKPFYDLVRNDPVMQASIDMQRGAKDKGAFGMFHALIDCVCAQNVTFKRLYGMLGNLASSFGDSVTVDGHRYFAFPTPNQLAQAPIEQIRACKVGYRDKAIQGISRAIATNEVDLKRILTLPPDEARTELMKLPSVGPYTADLAMIIGARYMGNLHLDLFVREALWQFYFDGDHVADKELKAFAAKQWGPFQGFAGFYLTTNTDIWSKVLGKEFRLKSGARNEPKVREKRKGK